MIAGAEELGRTRDASRARMELAFARRFQGAPDEAEELARQAHDPFLRTGDRYFVAQNLRLLSELAWDLGEDSAAASIAREAVSAASRWVAHARSRGTARARRGSGRERCRRRGAPDRRGRARVATRGDRGAQLLVLRMDVFVALAGRRGCRGSAASRRRVEIADELGRLLIAFRACASRETLARMGDSGPGFANALANARLLADEADAPWLVRAVEAAELGRERIPI